MDRDQMAMRRPFTGHIGTVNDVDMLSPIWHNDYMSSAAPADGPCERRVTKLVQMLCDKV